MPIDADTSAIVCAIAEVESGCDATAIGDGGRAISAYQIHEAFYSDCQQFIRHRPELGLNLGTQWRDIAADPDKARDCCAAGVLLIKGWLEAHGIVPTPDKIYAAYTQGRQSFADCGFDYNAPGFPKFKRGKCVRVAQLVQEQDKANQ